MSPAPRPVRERLYARLEPCPDTDCECLLWTGAPTGAGYGQISDGKKNKLVHRVIWELEVGPIPDGLTIDHVQDHGCRHRNCASVAHLEPVTHHVNVLRGHATSKGNGLRTVAKSAPAVPISLSRVISKAWRWRDSCARCGAPAGEGCISDGGLAMSHSHKGRGVFVKQQEGK